jgi:hypothetical protein
VLPKLAPRDAADREPGAGSSPEFRT